MRFLLHCLLFASLSFAPLALAGEVAPKHLQDEVLLAGENFGGFVESHPDLRNYRLGLREYRRGDLEKAFRFFRMASRYSDKPSQAIVAEMLWHGKGAELNRPLAYAWMDLAAERGNPRLLVQRERYWEAMSEAERAQALALGKQVYAEFGDAVAQRRLEMALRREKNQLAGSRTGYTGNTQIIAPVPGIGDAGGGDPSGAGTPTISVPASSFFASAYWDPKQYYAWRERLWEREQRELQAGVVEVRGIEQVKAGATEKARKGD